MRFLADRRRLVLSVSGNGAAVSGLAILADKGQAVTLLGILGVMISLVVWGIRALFSGSLVPRSTLTDARKSFDDRLAREREISELQRIANENIVEALKKQTEQMEALIGEQKLVRDVIASMKTAAESRSV